MLLDEDPATVSSDMCHTLHITDEFSLIAHPPYYREF